MSTTNDTSGAPERPRVVIAIAVVVCVALPMIVSSQQAGRFFQSLGTGTDAAILFLTACAIIFSSPVIAVLLSHSPSQTFRVMGFAVCAAIISFSVLTTTIAIHNKTGQKIASEQQSSAANTAIQASIDSNLAAIASLQVQIDRLAPARWQTKRAGYAQQIQNLQMQNMQLMAQQERQAKTGGGSVTGETFAALESWGISRFGLSVLAAVLLDAIPFVACLIIGSVLAVGVQYRRAAGSTHDGYGSVSAVGPVQKKRAA